MNNWYCFFHNEISISLYALLFKRNGIITQVRLLRPYLPDGTPITTSKEEHRLRVEAQALAAEEAERRRTAETLASEEAERRREAEAELERLRAQLADRQEENA